MQDTNQIIVGDAASRHENDGCSSTCDGCSSTCEEQIPYAQLHDTESESKCSFPATVVNADYHCHEMECQSTSHQSENRDEKEKSCCKVAVEGDDEDDESSRIGNKQFANKLADDDTQSLTQDSAFKRILRFMHLLDRCIKRIYGFLTRYAVKALFYSILAFCIFTIVVFVGAKFEAYHIERASSTLSFYETESVCAVDALAVHAAKAISPPALQTFETLMDARDSGKEVAHCGACGSCSNVNDIDIMAKTRGTLTGTTTDCAKKVFFGGREAVQSCMNQNVGFTDSCSNCWVDNVVCTQRRCKFTCIKSLFYYREGNNDRSSGKLNACLECDEKMCGPQFIQCSGANRRRLGITSDIQRDAAHEQCHSVDLDWTEEAELDGQ